MYTTFDITSRSNYPPFEFPYAESEFSAYLTSFCLFLPSPKGDHELLLLFPAVDRGLYQLKAQHRETDIIFCPEQEQPGTYNPQVEAISPILPDHLQQEEQSSLRTTKDELLQQISKVDREIAKTENQISNLKKKEQELEEKASKPEDKSEVSRFVEVGRILWMKELILALEC